MWELPAGAQGTLWYRIQAASSSPSSLLLYTTVVRENTVSCSARFSVGADVGTSRALMVLCQYSGGSLDSDVLSLRFTRCVCSAQPRCAEAAPPR